MKAALRPSLFPPRQDVEKKNTKEDQDKNKPALSSSDADGKTKASGGGLSVETTQGAGEDSTDATPGAGTSEDGSDGANGNKPAIKKKSGTTLPEVIADSMSATLEEELRTRCTTEPSSVLKLNLIVNLI